MYANADYPDSSVSNHSQYASFRHASKVWHPYQNPVTNNMAIRKFPRQGEYDNFHLHCGVGNYGFSLDNPNGSTKPLFNAPRIMTPFCRMDCFHMHWRWSFLTQKAAKEEIDRVAFRGWGQNDFGNWLKQEQAAAPLIPPNHRLRVFLLNNTNESSFSTLNNLLESPTIVTSTALGEMDDKRAIYFTDIFNPNP